MFVSILIITFFINDHDSWKLHVWKFINDHDITLIFLIPGKLKLPVLPMLTV